jgi:hypothetical protein
MNNSASSSLKRFGYTYPIEESETKESVRREKQIHEYFVYFFLFIFIRNKKNQLLLLLYHLHYELMKVKILMSAVQS